MTGHPPGARASTPVQQFAGVAASELETLDAFIPLLQQEREALVSGNADLLAPLMTRKNMLLQSLSECGEARARVLKDAGVAATAEDIRQFVASHPEGARIWEKVLASARRASEINTANAHLTNQRLAGIGRALVALTGARPGLYDPLGSRAQSVTTTRRLGSV
jgi:flagellar biosynthesis/type III secretory pathway chaperone